MTGHCVKTRAKAKTTAPTRSVTIALSWVWFCALVALSACALPGGCRQADAPRHDPATHVVPLPLQQARAYPETVTGRFVSLADFEDSPEQGTGHQQVGLFALRGGADGAEKKFVVNITRTGAGAMEVTLRPKSELTFRIPYFRDVSDYTLLSMALHSETLRDDLRVTLCSRGASWTSHRTLLRPGWNNVLIDIRRLANVPGFDRTNVRELRIAFADAAADVTFRLDDIMLIDNRRLVQPTPAGVALRKVGLDYELRLPQCQRPIKLTQSDDGLWRLGPDQPVVQLAPPSVAPADKAEHLELMGLRRVGQVAVVESNAIRLRLTNTWYFPSRAGQWASLAVRQIRWEYTFYADGRWVTHVELNNAGGQAIGSIRIDLPQPVAVAHKGVSRAILGRDVAGPVQRWSFMLAPPGMRAQAVANAYLNPGQVVLRRNSGDGLPNAYAPGDANRDGFDESQGCYYVPATPNASAINCRFCLVPPASGLLDPVTLVVGDFRNLTGPVSVNAEGLGIRRTATLADGSVLFVVPGRFVGETALEVAGKRPIGGPE